MVDLNADLDHCAGRRESRKGGPASQWSGANQRGVFCTHTFEWVEEPLTRALINQRMARTDFVTSNCTAPQ